MKYQIINRSDDLNIIGHYPQTALEEGYNPSLSNSHWNVKPNKFPNFLPNYELRLHKKAKTTDYLDGHGIIGMVVSETFRSILEKHKLPPHKFHLIKVYHKKDVLKYYWLQYIVDDFWKWVDKEKSKAVIYDIKQNFEAIQDLNLNLNNDDVKDLKYNKLPYHQGIRWEKVVFKKGFPNYDIYETQTFQFTSVISNSLLDAMLENRLTGFETKDFDKIFVNE